MKKKNRLLLRVTIVFLLICIGAVIPLYGEKMVEQSIRNAAQTWVREMTAQARPDAIVESMEPHLFEAETIAYIAYLSDSGFCLCGANDLVLPVYFYSPGDHYDPDNPGCKGILWEIICRTKNLQAGLSKSDPELLKYHAALERRAQMWEELISGRAPRRFNREAPLADPDIMSLDMEYCWRQGSPFNDYNPTVTPGRDQERTIVGCVGTSLAQILYYWNWPNTGVGEDSTRFYTRWSTVWLERDLASNPGITDSFWTNRLEWSGATSKLRMRGYWDGTMMTKAEEISSNPDYLAALNDLWNALTINIASLRANFEATTYRWGRMADCHDDPPDAGDSAAAILSYHAAISVGMDFGLFASTAFSSNIERAAEDHFQYHTDAFYWVRNETLIVRDIKWLRPAEMAGTDEDGGGHSWVIWGYDQRGPELLLRMNMGWGDPNGWWTCDSIDYDTDGAPDFDISQTSTTTIAPEDVVRFVNNTGTEGDGSPNSPHGDIEEVLGDPSLQDGSTLVFKAGSVNTFTPGSDLVINKELTLKGYNVEIRHGGP